MTPKLKIKWDDPRIKITPQMKTTEYMIKKYLEDNEILKDLKKTSLLPTNKSKKTCPYAVVLYSMCIIPPLLLFLVFCTHIYTHLARGLRLRLLLHLFIPPSICPPTSMSSILAT